VSLTVIMACCHAGLAKTSIRLMKLIVGKVMHALMTADDIAAVRYNNA